MRGARQPQREGRLFQEFAGSVRIVGNQRLDPATQTFVARASLLQEGCTSAFFPLENSAIQRIVAEGQKEGVIVDVPFPQVMGVCGGSLAMPILIGGALLDNRAVEGPFAHLIEKCLIADAGIDERIDLALRAIALPHLATARTTKKRGRK